MYVCYGMSTIYVVDARRRRGIEAVRVMLASALSGSEHYSV